MTVGLKSVFFRMRRFPPWDIRSTSSSKTRWDLNQNLDGGFVLTCLHSLGQALEWINVSLLSTLTLSVFPWRHSVKLSFCFTRLFFWNMTLFFGRLCTQLFLLSRHYIQIPTLIFLGVLRFEHRAAGWEERTPPLCYLPKKAKNNNISLFKSLHWSNLNGTPKIKK